MAGGTEEHTDVLARLAAIGLDERDAQIYIQLCVRGPTKASEVAAAAKVNRTEAYRSLDNLMRRGFVTASLDRPTLYEATDPEKVFDDALAQHTARRAHLERAREEAVRTLAKMRSSSTDGPLRTSYKILQGREAILAATETMLRRARVGQSMASTYFAAAHANEGNLAFMTTLHRAKDGLPMRLLLRDTPGVIESFGATAYEPNVQIRFFDPTGPLRFTIVDDTEVIFWLSTDGAQALHAKDDIAMWTNARDFVFAQALLYEALWRNARPAKLP